MYRFHTPLEIELMFNRVRITIHSNRRMIIYPVPELVSWLLGSWERLCWITFKWKDVSWASWPFTSQRKSASPAKFAVMFRSVNAHKSISSFFKSTIVLRGIPRMWDKDQHHHHQLKWISPLFSPPPPLFSSDVQDVPFLWRWETLSNWHFRPSYHQIERCNLTFPVSIFLCFFRFGQWAQTSEAGYHQNSLDD